MKRTLLIVLTAGIVSGGDIYYAYYAQQHADHQMPAKPAGSTATRPEVFCETMKTGQLCSHGTSSALGLTAEKAEAWVASVRKYNRAVNDAIVQLQAEAKGTLSPAQMAEVERWFAVGMNPKMNDMLVAAPAKAAPAAGARK